MEANLIFWAVGKRVNAIFQKQKDSKTRLSARKESKIQIKKILFCLTKNLLINY